MIIFKYFSLLSSIPDNILKEWTTNRIINNENGAPISLHIKDKQITNKLVSLISKLKSKNIYKISIDSILNRTKDQCSVAEK